MPVAGTVELVTRLAGRYKLAIVSTRAEAELRATSTTRADRLLPGYRRL